MGTLETFVNDWNTSEDSIFQSGIEEGVGGEVEKALFEWAHPKFRNYVGLSSIGKCMPLLKLYVNGYREPTTHRIRTVFLTGHIYESILIKSMKAYGLSVKLEQAEVQLNEFQGHIDCVVGDTITEIKTMSSSHFNAFTKSPNDSMGYVSQLASYMEGTGLPGQWLCYNKETSEIAVIKFPDELREDTLNKVFYKMNELRYSKDMAEVLAPEPRQEIYKGEPTGNLLIPPELYFSYYSRAFYRIVEGVNSYKKTQNYIVAIRSPQERQAWLDKYGVNINDTKRQEDKRVV